MKITLPELDHSYFGAFNKENDMFEFASFGRRLGSLITNSGGKLIVSLDSPWGAGKSTFAKMWRCEMEEIGHRVAYFDAFDHDYQDDPFLAICSAIYEQLDDADEATKKKFVESSKAAVKVIAKSALRILLKQLGGEVVASLVDENDPQKSLYTDELSSVVDERLEREITESESRRNQINSFKSFLSEMSGDAGLKSPTIIIIDELDRCKPNFALRIIEIAKHFFRADNVAFLLIMNKTQMEESVRLEYGGGINADAYLRKFIDLWVELPKKERFDRGANTKKYIKYCLDRMEYEPSAISEDDVVGCLFHFCEKYEFTFRDIERMISNFAVANNVNSAMHGRVVLVVCFLSALKVWSSGNFSKLARGEECTSELLGTLMLSRGVMPIASVDYETIVRKLIAYLSTKDESMKTKIAGGEIDNSVVSIDLMKVCEWFLA